MDLHDYLNAVRRHYRMVVAVVLFPVAVAAVVTWQITPQYASSTQLYVSTAGNEDVTAAYQGNLLSQQRVASYAKLLEGELVAERVIDRLDLATSPQTLIGQTRATFTSDTVILTATVMDPSPQQAQQLAATLASEFSALVAELETQAGAAFPAATITVVKRAQLPTTPATPNVLLNLGLALLVGAVLGVGSAVLRELMDNTIKTNEDVQEVTGAASIGSVMFDAGMAKRPLVSQSVGHSRSAEAYRQIRTNLQFLSVDDPPRVLVVTSAVPEEGKTTTAINLALVIAQSGKRVALVEGDLRRPRVVSYMRLIMGTGLTNVLAGTASAADVLQPFGDGRLSVIASGPTPPNPSELLGSAHMQQMMTDLRNSHDYVIIDAPPLLPVTDAAVLAVHADGAIIVTKHGATKREQLRLAAQSLHAIDAKILGVIVNMIPAKAGNYGYGYGYGYGYSPDGVSKHGTTPAVRELPAELTPARSGRQHRPASR